MSTIQDRVAACLSEESTSLADQFKVSCKVNGLSEVEQLNEINSYFRMQLGMMEESTSTARECLIDNLPLRTWIRDFKKHVVPVVKANGLTVWTN